MNMKNNKRDINIKKNKFAKSILDKIEREHIKQVPKWRFILKNYGFWFLVVVSIFTAGVATSLIISSIFHMDIPIANLASGSILKHVMLFMPYFWMMLLSIFIVFGLGTFINTKYGYRHSFIFITGLSIIISVLFGSFIYFTGGVNRLEHYTRMINSNYYLNLEQRREQMWIHPDNGLLAGIPLNLIEEDGEFTLIDFTGKTWVIDSDILEDEDIAIVSVVGKVAIIGTKIDKNTFKACRIVPWERFMNKSKTYNNILGFIGSGHYIDERNIFELRNNLCR